MNFEVKNTPILISEFSKVLIQWHRRHGRQNLPWQNNRDPYAVWVSEIMLQQTQVATVLERYPRFMKHFPSISILAEAEIDEVLAEWSGLGYYSRARNLHACAKQVMSIYSGKFPNDPLLLAELKGIGRSTAGAIAAFAFKNRTPILDANVKRVLARIFGVEGFIQEKSVNEKLWELAQSLLPADNKVMPIYTQALMDFGATWCTSRKPVCLTTLKKCPYMDVCHARLSNRVLDLPARLKKIKSPEFECQMGLIRKGNFVLLKKRPDKAIWGGLWSLPESLWSPKMHEKNEEDVFMSINKLFDLVIPAEKVPKAWLKSSNGSVIKGPKIKHVFSHRRLWMQIWELHVIEPFNVSKMGLAWVSLRQLGKFGLPQPIKLLLGGLSLVRDDDLKN